jgi:BarA-like signal transduction histidine kinase
MDDGRGVMRKHAKDWIRVAVMAGFVAGPSYAADDLAKDLTSTIALLGLPCGQVVSAQKLKDNDYLALCKDKNRYRVFINAEGRVVAQKQ